MTYFSVHMLIHQLLKCHQCVLNLMLQHVTRTQMVLKPLRAVTNYVCLKIRRPGNRKIALQTHNKAAQLH